MPVSYRCSPKVSISSEARRFDELTGLLRAAERVVGHHLSQQYGRAAKGPSGHSCAELAGVSTRAAGAVLFASEFILRRLADERFHQHGAQAVDSLRISTRAVALNISGARYARDGEHRPIAQSSCAGLLRRRQGRAR